MTRDRLAALLLESLDAHWQWQVVPSGPSDLAHLLADDLLAAGVLTEALAKVRGEVVALIEEHGGLCVVSGDPEDPICETHSEMMFDGFCEDDPRDLRAVLAILDAASGGGGER